MGPGETTRRRSPARLKRPWQGGLFLVLAGVAATGCMLLLWGAGKDYLRLAGAAACALTAFSLGRLGQHRRTPVLESYRHLLEFLGRSGIPCAVYLRRFCHEALISHEDRSAYIPVSDEERVARGFAQYCLFVAIGRPGEPLPGRGAYRMYVSDDEWRETVSALVEVASVVVFRWAPSESLEWELGEVRRRGKEMRAVYLIPALEPGEDLGGYVPDDLADRFDLTGERAPPDAVPAFLLDGQDGEARLIFRHAEESLDDAAARLAEDHLGLSRLDRAGRRAVGSLYGPAARLATGLGRLAIHAIGVIVAGMGLIVLDILTFRLMDRLPLEDVFIWGGTGILVSLGILLIASTAGGGRTP